jgi:hypothetical protein
LKADAIEGVVNELDRRIERGMPEDGRPVSFTCSGQLFKFQDVDAMHVVRDYWQRRLELARREEARAYRDAMAGGGSADDRCRAKRGRR